MIRIRPYKNTDAKTILSWCQDERAFYQWTAGVMGEFPITDNEFSFVENLMPFTAFDENGVLGFFTYPITLVTIRKIKNIPAIDGISMYKSLSLFSDLGSLKYWENVCGFSLSSG